jgi:hypothetical protein
LSWSNTSATTQDYSSINFLFSTEEFVWKPALIIENEITYKPKTILSDKHTGLSTLCGLCPVPYGKDRFHLISFTKLLAEYYFIN